jgi:hypothetical protein
MDYPDGMSNDDYQRLIGGGDYRVQCSVCGEWGMTGDEHECAPNAKRIIREVIADVPIKFTVYHRDTPHPWGNHAHSLMSPARDFAWYIVAEVNADGTTHEEFFGGPLAVFEGQWWKGHTGMEDGRDRLLADLRAFIEQDILDILSGKRKED